MASISEKKSEQVAVKLAPATLEMIERICQAEDRPVGYVVRELMLRGLALYHEDGNLRSTNSPHRLEDAFHEGIKRAIPADIGQTKKLAPVIATITPATPTRADVRRMIGQDEIAEIERRVTPRKTQSVPVLKSKAK